ncbi:MAG: lipid-A-disaccharide synthase N-terminal domain-containing protein, partial [Verrucomicrobiales bacterium]
DGKGGALAEDRAHYPRGCPRGNRLPLAAPQPRWNTGRMIIPAIFLATVLDQLRSDHWGWTALGFAAQGLFSMRFLIQWLASEKQQKFVMPIQFWHFSIIGGSLNLLYSLHLWKAPLIFGAVASLFTSSRSYMLHKRGLKAESETL